jgi:hypothetical protein
MAFRTVFDAAEQGYSASGFVYIGLTLMALGALMVFRPALMQRLLPRGAQGRARVIFSRLYLGFACAWTLAAFVATYTDHRNAQTALADGRYEIVEGTVQDFVPMPYEGHALESFSVNGRRFSYSDYVASAGFRQTTAHGGPIREGLRVRVTHAGNVILRLEVAE